MPRAKAKDTRRAKANAQAHLHQFDMISVTLWDTSNLIVANDLHFTTPSNTRHVILTINGINSSMVTWNIPYWLPGNAFTAPTHHATREMVNQPLITKTSMMPPHFSRQLSIRWYLMLNLINLSTVMHPKPQPTTLMRMMTGGNKNRVTIKNSTMISTTMFGIRKTKTKKRKIRRHSHSHAAQGSGIQQLSRVVTSQ
jgi:hypothetical protein